MNEDARNKIITGEFDAKDKTTRAGLYVWGEQ